jgi:hypothetical protein
MHQPHNPVIGYHAYDHDYHIIAPDETSNLVYYSAARALQAASDYGQAQRVSGISPLHLDGILSIIFHDTGDILLEGGQRGDSSKHADSGNYRSISAICQTYVLQKANPSIAAVIY